MHSTEEQLETVWLPGAPSHNASFPFPLFPTLPQPDWQHRLWPFPITPGWWSVVYSGVQVVREPGGGWRRRAWPVSLRLDGEGAPGNSLGQVRRKSLSAPFSTDCISGSLQLGRGIYLGLSRWFWGLGAGAVEIPSSCQWIPQLLSDPGLQEQAWTLVPVLQAASRGQQQNAAAEALS